jgi:hypothetical protein
LSRTDTELVAHRYFFPSIQTAWRLPSRNSHSLPGERGAQTAQWTLAATYPTVERIEQDTFARSDENGQKLERYHAKVKAWYMDMAETGWDTAWSHLSSMQPADEVVEQGNEETVESNTQTEE